MSTLLAPVAPCAASAQAQRQIIEPHTRLAPLPAVEAGLTKVDARPYIRITDTDAVLEGPGFERDGSLVFCDVTGGRVLRLSPQRRLTTVATFEGANPGGIAIHRDGRIFVALIAPGFERGYVLAMRPDGSDRQIIVPAERGYLPNDLVFDDHGGFYFTDFRGSSTDGSGGVFYVDPADNQVTPVLRGLGRANGIALAPDGRTLWAIEHGRNLLHRINLTDATTVAPLGTSIPYRFAGPPPDSMRIDADGNLYVGLMDQGSVLVLSPAGVPIGQILIPGRDEGRDLATSNLAIRPGGTSLLIMAGNKHGGHGAAIFEAKAFGKGMMPFSHR